MHFLSLISLEINPSEELLVTGPFLHSHIKIYWDEQMVVSVLCALFNSYSVFMADYFFFRSSSVVDVPAWISHVGEKLHLYCVCAVY